MNTAPHALASRLRIVLVGTQHPGNIGSAARAIKTMGLSRLVLVAPEKAPNAESYSLAAGADDVPHSGGRDQAGGGGDAGADPAQTHGDLLPS